jgi:hypothetical protein
MQAVAVIDRSRQPARGIAHCFFQVLRVTPERETRVIIDHAIRLRILPLRTLIGLHRDRNAWFIRSVLAACRATVELGEICETTRVKEGSCLS